MVTAIKGDAIRVFENRGTSGLSDVVVDCTGYNAISVFATPAGGNAVVTVTVKNAPIPIGPFYAVSDPAGTRTGVSSGAAYDVLVGGGFVKLDLAITSGSGTLWTIWVVPYIAAGVPLINVNASTILGTVRQGAGDVTAAWRVQQGPGDNTVDPWRIRHTYENSPGPTGVQLRNLAGTVTDFNASGRHVYGLWVVNASGAAVWVQIYNSAAASVTLGVTAPYIELYVPNNTMTPNMAGFGGIQFTTSDSQPSASATTGAGGSGAGAAAGVYLFAQVTT